MIDDYLKVLRGKLNCIGVFVALSVLYSKRIDEEKSHIGSKLVIVKSSRIIIL